MSSDVKVNKCSNLLPKRPGRGSKKKYCLNVVSQSGSISNIDFKTLSEVVESTYDCVLNPARWDHAVGIIAELCRSQCCVLSTADLEKGGYERTFQVGYDEHYRLLHKEKYGVMNPYVARLRVLPAGKVVTGAKLMSDHDFLESRYYQEWVKPQGLRYTVGLNVLKNARVRFALSVSRPRSEGPYEGAENRILALIAPHIRRALTISYELNLRTISSDALETTLDRLTCGVYLAARDGRIIYMNRAAERQVRSGNVLSIGNHRLIAVNRVARTALTKAIAEAASDEDETLSCGMAVALPRHQNGGMGLIAKILPLGRGQRRHFGETFAATTAIFVQDPEVAPLDSGTAFSKLYGLTPSELRLLLAMLPGRSIKEVAEVLGICETTAKTHLHHIHMKTATSRQTQLLHLLMRSTPPVQPVAIPQLLSA